ncbi:polymer-forming cytoskeletal protein [beta proteobacterium MWH-UniP1]
MPPISRIFKKKTEKSFLLLEGELFRTLVGPKSEVHGRLRVGENVRIDGQVLGDIEATSGTTPTVAVAETGFVDGDIAAHRVLVAGRVSGSIQASERVELTAGAVVEGNIWAKSVGMNHGATVKGLISGQTT